MQSSNNNHYKYNDKIEEICTLKNKSSANTLINENILRVNKIKNYQNENSYYTPKDNTIDINIFNKINDYSIKIKLPSEKYLNISINANDNIDKLKKLIIEKEEENFLNDADSFRLI